jgi:periplasmic protein TonB
MTSHHYRAEAFCAALIRRVAHTLPTELSERLEEEWLADLASRQGALAQLRLAAGCLWASRIIAHDFLAGAAVASPAGGQRAVVALAPQSFSPFSRRGAMPIVIIGIHVVLIYAFASGFAVRIIEKVAKPMVTVDMAAAEPKPPPEPFAVRKTTLENKGPVVPDLALPPQVVVEPTITAPAIAEGAGVDSGHVFTGGVVVTPVRHIGGPGSGFPTTDDYYPDSAIRQREEGSAAVQVCVNEKGKLNSTPTLLQSSGFAQLDEGALKLAKAGSGHYRSTTEDGRPVSDCFAFRVRYQLKQ